MKNFLKLLTILFLFVFVAAITFFMINATYTNDDWWTCFFITNFFKTILNSDQGQIMSWLAMKFITDTVPSILHFHPQHNVIMQILRGVNFAIAFYLISMYFDLKKREIPHISLVAINSLLTFLPVILYDFIMLIFVNTHYKYLFVLIIGTTIWAIWFREFLNDEFLKNKKVVRNYIFALVLAACGHIVSIPSLFIIIFLYLYYFFKSNNDMNIAWSNFRNLILIYITYMILDFNLPGFTYIQDSRKVEDPIIYFITHFSNYTCELFTYIFTQPFICGIFIVTILGLICMIIFRKKINARYTVIAISLLISIFIFEYSLLICGRTFYDHKSYWFVSGEITYTLNFYLLLVCNVTYGCLFRLINNKKIRIFFTGICFILILLLYPISDAYKKMIYIHNNLMIQQTDIYKINKLFSYYSQISGPIYIPTSYYRATNAFFTWVPIGAVDNNMRKIFKIDSRRKIIEIPCVMKNENEFFTKDELEKIDFNRLFDKNFITQTKTPEFECIK